MEHPNEKKQFKTIEVSPSEIKSTLHEGGNPWNQNDTWPGSSSVPDTEQFKTIEIKAKDLPLNFHEGGNPWNGDDTWPGSSSSPENENK